MGPSSETGFSNMNDWFVRFYVGCLQMGFYPETDDLENAVDISPVDFAAKSMTYVTALHPKVSLFVLFNPFTLQGSS